MARLRQESAPVLGTHAEAKPATPRTGIGGSAEWTSMDDHPGVGPLQADAAERCPVFSGVFGDSPRQGAGRRIKGRGLVRLRRPHCVSMATWCSSVREAHRQLQRALKRDEGLPATSKSLPRSSPMAGRAACGVGGLLERAREDLEEEPEEDEGDDDLDDLGEASPLESATRKWKGAESSAVKIILFRHSLRPGRDMDWHGAPCSTR